MPTIHHQGNWKIVMYFDDHGAPHFHLRTPDAEAKVAIETLDVIVGDVDRKTLSATGGVGPAQPTGEQEKCTGMRSLYWLKWPVFMDEIAF